MSFVPPVSIVAWPASVLLLAFAAGTDVRDRRIPNKLVAAVCAVGLAQGLAVRPGLVWLSLLVAVAVFCGLGVLSHYRIIGGGDLKLISAVTFLVPPEHVGQLLIEIALAGGALACVYLGARFGLKNFDGLPESPFGAVGVARPESGLALAIKMERARIVAGDPLPYAVAVLGGVCIYIAKEFFQCFYAISCSL